VTASDPPLILWGRCRSGGRWFWYAQIVGGDDAYDWAPTEVKAARRANAAAVKLAAGQYATIHVLHGVATSKLKALNAAKRAAKPAADTDDANANGYLYGIDHGHFDFDDREWIPAKVVRLPIVKKTPKRIYYTHPAGHHKFQVKYVDRQQVERHGSALAPSSDYFALFAHPPELGPPEPEPPRPRYPRSNLGPHLDALRKATAPPDLKKLKAAMADAHPDRGGSSAAFIRAREQYVSAKRLAGVR
jgi:hypothetical protein